VTTSIGYSDSLKRRVRVGDWEDQRRSTWDKVVEAMERDDRADAAALAELTIDEAKIIFDIMGQWQADLRAMLGDKGVPPDERAAIEASIGALIVEPDGTPHDRHRSWARFLELTLQLQGEIWRGDFTQARETVAAQRERWRIEHDRDADLTYGLMSALIERFGEQVVPEIYERIAWPLFVWRYAKFDVSQHDWASDSLPTLMYVALEAMRAHLCTVNRDGSPLDLIDEGDRWTIRFDPCGSGGRLVRGDWVEGTPSRMEPPYNWRIIEGAYDWTDGKEGICAYCNHCQVVMEHLPMDRFGYPVRVVEPPQYPTRRGVRVDDRSEDRQKCTWSMYKDPTAVPAEFYTRAGRTKPDRFGSEAIGSSADTRHTGFMGGG
jgi:hypothetical protein